MLIKIGLLLFVVGSSLGGPFSRLETAKPRVDEVNYRLPGDVVPIRYEITLEPDFTTKKFSGLVRIEIEVKNITDKIILHHRELDMPTKDKITVIGTDLPVVKTAAKTGTPEQEFFQITLEKNLTVGAQYTVEIKEFNGTLNNANQGFYFAEYKDSTGKDRKFATTQFEPTAARRAFPCFDEPSMKATFKITIVRPTSYNSVSNMKKVKTRKAIAADKEEDVFEETVRMSTYLIAFIVSEMELSDQTQFHRVLAKSEDLKAGKHLFALETGKLVLDKIGEWLNVAYPLNKMDQAAIPDKYFSAGAMENWGLVTYRETALLYSKETLTSRHQSIATIIAHEFGHQWFGNLVTPEWWKYIWLNEGFATYFEHWGAAQAKPEWDLMDQFVILNTQYVFEPDSFEETRPMNFDAGKPSEISNLFDRIAYEKSGSVIRMMEMFLTTEVFKTGLKNYLDARAYKVATPDDLYTAMQTSVNKVSPKVLPADLTVSQIMKSWDSVPGYPVVTVERKYSTAENNVVLKQSRFLIEKANSSDTNNWIIPVNFATKSENRFDVTTADLWLKSREASTTVKLDDSDWLIVNKKETGYYRVNYDETNWNLLANALKEDHSKIHLLNRAQLLDDSYNLARSQRLSYKVPLDLSMYLAKEKDYIPFYSFFTAIKFLNNMLIGTTQEKNIQNHIVVVLGGVYSSLGFDEKTGDKHVDKLNRISVLTWLCNMGHTECRTKSLEKFRSWKENDTAIAINLQAPIYCGAMRKANQSEWDYLYAKYGSLTDAEHRSRILPALGCSENSTILEAFLDKSVASENSIHPNVGFTHVNNGGSIGVQTAFDYISKNFETLNAQLDKYMLESIIESVGGKMNTKEQREKLIALSEKHKAQKDLFLSGIVRAAANIKWNEDNLKDITAWFTKDDDTDGGSMSHMYASFLLIFVSYIMCTVIG